MFSAHQWKKRENAAEEIANAITAPSPLNSGQMPKASPRPLTPAGKIGGDSMIPISEDEAEEHNLRVLTCCDSLFEADQSGKHWLIPMKDPVPLLFLRQMFTKLYQQQQYQHRTQLYMDQADKCKDDKDDGRDNHIPTEAFQRAFERLFFALGEDDGFDSRRYDRNNDGLISWTEFTYVFNDHKFHLKLTIPERIFITFDNPESSIVAQFLQAFMLSTIVVSSLGFILSTSPNFQNEPVGRNAPEPYKFFTVVENICLTIFLLEYLIRLCTCWSVRDEVVDKEKLMKLVVGDGTLELSTPSGRLFRFLVSVPNIIDVIAIAPGVLGWIITLEGGGFVVLRLVRLTRIFRAFKNPKLVEPVIVIARTMSQSTKALYLLAFNGLLGILISGSLMYLVEKGEWDASTRSYNRYVGRSWDATTGKWIDNKAESPFYSIPHAFWWAVVTATTVGYGDTFPTTSWGYVVAAATMVFSLVIAALPVGVIGGNFSQSWADYDQETKAKAAGLRRDKRFITEAIQRTDPFEMSKLLYIELWNERFITGTQKSKRPDLAEFMGQAHLILQCPPDSKYGSGPVTVPLRDGAEGALPRRKITGSVTIEYLWTPQKFMSEKSPKFSKQMTVGSQKLPCLQGELKFTLIRAENLINLTYSCGEWSLSNPYARVFCYPNAPKEKVLHCPVAWQTPFARLQSEKLLHCPVAWRSPNAVRTLSPEWNISKTFKYDWSMPEESEAASDKLDGSAEIADIEQSKAGPITQIVKQLEGEMLNLQRVLHDLNGNVAQLSLASPPASENPK